MAEGTNAVSPEKSSTQHNPESPSEENTTPETGGLSPDQRRILERCLHALTHAKNDSHTLAALLLITRLCPAGELDRATLRRIFEAVGLSLPARLLVTAIQGRAGSTLPPDELLSLGTALLAALSTDPDMASHPQLLTTVPLLLGLLADGHQHTRPDQNQSQPHQTQTPEQDLLSQPAHSVEVNLAGRAKSPGAESGGATEPGECQGAPSSSGVKADAVMQKDGNAALGEAMAADCYQVLDAVCALPQGPELLLNRGAVPSLCRAVSRKQTLSRERGLPLLGHLLSGRVRQRAWSKHPTELVSLLAAVAQEFASTTAQDQLNMCSQLPQFLPPPDGAPVGNAKLKEAVASVWGVLRPMVQSKLTVEQLGPVLVLAACLLDLFGWEVVGSPKFCCLLVNRACVEVRMGLEELPGTQLSLQRQHLLTACYRIMEAAMEQACNQESGDTAAQPQTSIVGLSLQQSRQVLGALEEAFSAVIYYLQQVDHSRHDDPFLLATFRSLCVWLAEETSCLKDEVTAILPFLIGYARDHLQGAGRGKSLADWMEEMSIDDGSQEGSWAGEDALRYLLPALCHLSAEESPRRALLCLDTPAMLVGFLSRGLAALRTQSAKSGGGDPALETACSSLLNFTVTEPERVRTDPCFASLESLLSEAFPALLHKPRLLVLTANCCTLGLMMGRLKSAHTGEVDPRQRRFFSAALRFLQSALEPSDGPGNGLARLTPTWVPRWEEVAELWRLSLQALAGCVRTQPRLAVAAREDGWLSGTLALLGSCSALPDPQTQGALEEALCALAQHCPLCRQDIVTHMKKESRSVLCSMPQLSKAVTA